ncbi:MAG: YkgJ family cysteine cluster protein [Rhodoferax sp.]|uniref:YkgJ family cysteine cluster protein n=1 Tax=Rhodoferax sp. TaxID=50421 RepID=UPI0032664BE5
MNTTISFACSACGKCCNSPPMMTVPELFHHENLFVGTLGVRPGAAGAFDLVTQGLDYPANGACPARGPEGLCNIHHHHKPAMCRTVPLDPFHTDATQHQVLLHRHTGAGYIGAECIAPGEREDMAVLVANGAVVDPGYRQQLHTHRQLLAEERDLWGTAVTHMLRGQVPPAPQGGSGGMLTLPLVPILSVLAAWSEACRLRCLRYVQQQCALLDRQIGLALQRKREQDRAVTAEFRTYAAAYRRLAEALARDAAPLAGSARDGARAEAYLGLTGV